MKVQPKLPYWIRERDLDFIDDEKLDKIESIEKETITTAKSFRRELLRPPNTYMENLKDNSLR